MESYGPDKSGKTDVRVEERTHARTHSHMYAHTPKCRCDDYTSLAASGLDKNGDASSPNSTQLIKVFVYKTQVNPIHTILKYGDYYNSMDR